MTLRALIKAHHTQAPLGWLILQICLWGLVCGLAWTIHQNAGMGAAIGLAWVFGWRAARAWLLAILKAMEGRG